MSDPPTPPTVAHRFAHRRHATSPTLSVVSTESFATVSAMLMALITPSFGDYREPVLSWVPARPPPSASMSSISRLCCVACFPPIFALFSLFPRSPSFVPIWRPSKKPLGRRRHQNSLCDRMLKLRLKRKLYRVLKRMLKSCWGLPEDKYTSLLLSLIMDIRHGNRYRRRRIISMRSLPGWVHGKVRRLMKTGKRCTFPWVSRHLRRTIQ